MALPRKLKTGETPEAALELPRFVFAPVTAGAQAGRVTYFADGREVGGGAGEFGPAGKLLGVVRPEFDQLLAHNAVAR